MQALKAQIWRIGLSLFALLPAISSTVMAQTKGEPPAAAAAAPAPGYYVTRSGTAMGTFVQIRVYIDKPAATHTAELESTIGGHIERAFAEIRRLEALMTTWSETSDVARINAAATRPTPGPITVSAEVLDCVERSLTYSKLSQG